MRGLYAITPEGAEGERLLALAAAAFAGGARLMQYRAKPGRLRDAKALVALARRHSARLIVNDDAGLASEAGADGVHLGRDDGDVAQARKVFPRGLIGASCYDSLERAKSAAAAGADYIAFGSVFPSPTKPGAVRAPLKLFSEARHLGLPMVAIGGITLQNAPQVLAAGADCVAVISAVFDARDVSAAARAFGLLFEKVPSE